MAVTVGSIIQDSDFNSLQSRIGAIMGTGSGTLGYGQTLASSSVVAGTTITATHFNNLYTDISKAYVHQNGTLPTTLASVSIGDTIGANTSSGTNSTLKGVNDLETVLASVEASPLVVSASQASVESKLTSQRTTAWNGTITHVFTVTFSDANHRRYFFNTGGEIRISASLTGGSGAKDTDWATMLTNMGTIKLNYTETVSTGTGTGSAIGNYDITSSSQTIFTKTGSGVYAENSYVVKVLQLSTSQIQFTIEFQDNDAGDLQDVGGTAIDENVTGTLTSTISQYRATGSYVSVATPTFSTSSAL